MPPLQAASGPVDDRDLRVFLVVAETLHIANAADSLGLTSSRVSQVLNRLERRIGGKVLNRSTRAVSLTPLGERLHASASSAVAMLDRTVAEAREVAVGLQSSLTIGCYNPVLFSAALNTILRRFERRHPAVSISIVDVGSGMATFDVLRRGGCDVLVSRPPMDDRDIVVGPIIETEPRVVLLARDHPLAAHDELVYEQLADYPVTDHPSLPRPIMDAFVPPRTPSGRLLSRKVCASFADIVRAAAAGQLVHPTLPSAARTIGNDELTTRPIVDLPESGIAFMWLVQRSADPLIGALVDVVEQDDTPRNE